MPFKINKKIDQLLFNKSSQIGISSSSTIIKSGRKLIFFNSKTVFLISPVLFHLDGDTKHDLKPIMSFTIFLLSGNLVKVSIHIQETLFLRLSEVLKSSSSENLVERYEPNFL